MEACLGYARLLFIICFFSLFLISRTPWCANSSSPFPMVTLFDVRLVRFKDNVSNCSRVCSLACFLAFTTLFPRNTTLRRWQSRSLTFSLCRVLLLRQRPSARAEYQYVLSSSQSFWCESRRPSCLRSAWHLPLAFTPALHLVPGCLSRPRCLLFPLPLGGSQGGFSWRSLKRSLARSSSPPTVWKKQFAFSCSSCVRSHTCSTRLIAAATNCLMILSGSPALAPTLSPVCAGCSGVCTASAASGLCPVCLDSHIDFLLLASRRPETTCRFR